MFEQCFKACINRNTVTFTLKDFELETQFCGKLRFSNDKSLQNAKRAPDMTARQLFWLVSNFCYITLTAV